MLRGQRTIRRTDILVFIAHVSNIGSVAFLWSPKLRCSCVWLAKTALSLQGLSAVTQHCPFSSTMWRRCGWSVCVCVCVCGFVGHRGLVFVTMSDIVCRIYSLLRLKLLSCCVWHSCSTDGLLTRSVNYIRGT